jgi:hypothetical protein
MPDVSFHSRISTRFGCHAALALLLAVCMAGNVLAARPSSRGRSARGGRTGGLGGSRKTSIKAVASAGADGQSVAVDVTSGAAEVGKEITVLDLTTVLAEGTLAAYKDVHGRAAGGKARLTIPLPAFGKGFRKLQIGFGKRAVCTVNTSKLNIDRMYMARINRMKAGFSSFVFSDRKFPEYTFEDPKAVDALVGRHTIKIDFYDDNYRPTRSAARPGRYGAVVRITAGRGGMMSRRSRGRGKKEDEDKAPALPPNTIQRCFVLYKVDGNIDPAKDGGIKIRDWGFDPSKVSSADKSTMDAAVRSPTSVSSAQDLGVIYSRAVDSPYYVPGAPTELLSKRFIWKLMAKNGQNPPIGKNGLHPYFIHKPGYPIGYSPTSDKLWPTIVMFHGGGGQAAADGRDMLCRDIVKKEYLVFCPGCPGGNWNWTQMDITVESFIAKYNVDPNRIIITSHSMGSWRSPIFVAKSPWIAAGFVPCNGGGINREMGEIFIRHNIAIWAVCGENDDARHRKGSDNMFIGALAAGHPSARYSCIPGVGHGAQYSAWLFNTVPEWGLTLNKKKPLEPPPEFWIGVPEVGQKTAARKLGRSRRSGGGKLPPVTDEKVWGEDLDKRHPEFERACIAPKNFGEIMNPTGQTKGSNPWRWGWYDCALTLRYRGEANRVQVPPHLRERLNLVPTGKDALTGDTSWVNWQKDVASDAVSVVVKANPEDMTIDCSVMAPERFIGKSCKVAKGRKSLATAPLVEGPGLYGDKAATCVVKVPYPPFGMTYGALNVIVGFTTADPLFAKIGKETLNKLNLSSVDTNQKYIEDLNELEFSFDTYVFGPGRFPKYKFNVDMKQIRDLVGKCETSVRFFDRQCRQVKWPEKPGRYGALVTLRGEGSAATRQKNKKDKNKNIKGGTLSVNKLITLYCTADKLADPGKKPRKPYTIEMSGISLSASDGSVSKQNVLDAMNKRDPKSALYLATQHDRQNGFFLPNDWNLSPQKMNEYWWIKCQYAAKVDIKPRVKNFIHWPLSGHKNTVYPCLIYLMYIDENPIYDYKWQFRNYFGASSRMDFLVMVPFVDQKHSRYDVEKMQELLIHEICKAPIDPYRIVLAGRLGASGFCQQWIQQYPKVFSGYISVQKGFGHGFAQLLKNEGIATWLWGGMADYESVASMDRAFEALVAVNHPLAGYSRIPGQNEKTLINAAFHVAQPMYDYMLRAKAGEKIEPIYQLYPVPDESKDAAGEKANKKSGSRLKSRLNSRSSKLKKTSSKSRLKSRSKLSRGKKGAEEGAPNPGDRRKTLPVPPVRLEKPLIDTRIQYPMPAVGDWQNRGMEADKLIWVWPWFDAALTAKERGK